MAVTTGILSPYSAAEERIVPSLEAMAEKVSHLKGLGYKVVLTSGSFDLIHLGHVKYLQRAKECGDILAVGVDCDEKIRRRKGSDRPMVPEDERLQLLAYQRPVDLIYLKRESDERWGLLKAVAPDVLVLTVDHSYSAEQQQALAQYCGRIEVIERQASVTTSERIRQMYLHMGERLGPKLAQELGPKLSELLPGLIESLLQRR
ncbi:MAG: adenylyltransferase/cytidyltransferase family protein [Solirubrobacteraceae bacterium]